MNTLPHLRRRQRLGLHLTLAFVLLMQGAIPLQAHTQLANDGRGHVVIICTWDGQRTAEIDDPVADPDSSTARLSPSCLFSQLLSAAAPADASLLPFTLYRFIAGDNSRACPPFVSTSVDLRRIRAPPVIIQA